MHIKIKKLIMNNFLSFGKAELDLTDKGFCLVSGRNNNPRDNALSNGSGKSSWGSAICYALTGQTINGLSKNLKNINVSENSCFVTLLFDIDANSYEVTRYAAPKSDLKIILNGRDISGKGIRESETILAKYLPDLTSQLIASIIILGQGLPCKFSANTPSGRKEVLEKLSKSDFMIQDLKERITTRINALNAILRGVQDKLLVLDTNAKNSAILRVKCENKIAELNVSRDFEKEINVLLETINKMELLQKQTQESITQKNLEYNKLNESVNAILVKKNEAIEFDNNEFSEFYKAYLSKKTSLESQINELNRKIREIKNIKDVCPTCGQKLPNVIKPSTENEEYELNNLTISLSSLNGTYEKNNVAHIERLKNINAQYQLQINDTQTALDEVKKELVALHAASNTSDLFELKTKLNTVQMEKNNHLKNLEDAKKELSEIIAEEQKLASEIQEYTTKQNDIEAHIKVVNQLNTLVKRDFRGYLLKDIIDYIDLRAKEYSEVVFGTRDLSFELDGNNINISYCNKAFENLSGGEKQRLDLIIQFAIRDMMSRYLGFSSNILILDEIFDNLDAKSTSSILNLITTKLSDVESIFIISHHSEELDLPVDSQITIVKDENGISDIR